VEVTVERLEVKDGEAESRRSRRGRLRVMIAFLLRVR
jgi:hypothetical protein